MNSNGNIYRILGEADKRRIEEQIKEKLVEIPPDQETTVRAMTRQQRRAWYREQQKVNR